VIVGIVYKFSFACFQVKFHQSPSVKILSILWLGSAIILIPYSKGFSFQSSREPTNVSQSERSYVFYWTDGGFNQGCSGILLRTKALSTPLEEFENRGIILKTHHMFSVHATPDEFKNKTITGHFGFVWLKLGMGNPTIPCMTSSFSKSSVFKLFSDQTNTQRRRLEIPPTVYREYENLCFRDGLMWTIGLIVEIKLSFQIPST